MNLYISENGLVTCQDHGGQYLKQAVAANPANDSHTTPRNHWVAVPAALAAQNGLSCEKS